MVTPYRISVACLVKRKGMAYTMKLVKPLSQKLVERWTLEFAK